MVKMTSVVIGTVLYAVMNPTNPKPNIERWQVRGFWEENGQMFYVCQCRLSGAGSDPTQMIFNEDGFSVDRAKVRELHLTHPKVSVPVEMNLYWVRRMLYGGERSHTWIEQYEAYPIDTQIKTLLADNTYKFIGKVKVEK